MDWSIREIEYFNLVSNQKTSPSSPHQRSDRFLVKKEEQGSGQSFRRKVETAASRLCDDAMYLENWTMQQQSEVRQQRGSVSERTRKRNFNCGTSLDVRVIITISRKNCLHNSREPRFLWSSQSKERNPPSPSSKIQSIFDEKGGARERSKFSLKAETAASGFCDDARSS